MRGSIFENFRFPYIPAACTFGALQLVGNVVRYEGRVEICDQCSSWATICDDFWDISDASVVCTQLGFQAVGWCRRSQMHYSY